MTNPNYNYWADRLDPQKEAERRARQSAIDAEQRRLVEQYQRQQQYQTVMSQMGPAILDTIQGYLDRNMPARSDKVEADVAQRLGSTPDDVRTALEYLKQAGNVHELVSSTQGYMGEKTTHLYPLEG